MGRFLRDYGLALGRRAWVAYGTFTAIVGVVTAILTDEPWTTATVVVTFLLVGSALAGYELWRAAQEAEEARREAMDSRRLNLHVSAGSGVRVLEPTNRGHYTHDEWILRVPGFRVTNRSTTAKVSLDVTLIADMRGGSLSLDDREARAVSWPFKDQHLALPIGINPEETESGTLGYALPELFAEPFTTELRTTMDHTNPVPTTFKLEIRDRVSTESITIPVPGEYPVPDPDAVNSG